MAVEFRGDAKRFVLRVAGYFALVSAVGAFVLFGNAWFRPFLVSLVFVAPLLLAMGLWLHRFDRLVFDDDARMLRRPLGPSIAYDSVTSLQLGEAASGIRLTVGRSERRLLVSANPADVRRLHREITSRWSEGVLVQSDGSVRWWMLAAVGFVILLGEAHIRILEVEFPTLREPCTVVDWPMAVAGYRTERFGAYRFSALPGFAGRPGEVGHQGPIFYSDDRILAYADAPVNAARAPDGMANQLARYGLGLANGADAMRFIACATGGVLPLMIKPLVLDPAFVSRSVFEGGVAVIRDSEDADSYAWVADVYIGHGKEGMRVSLGSNAEIENELLEELVARVEFAPQQD